MWINPFVEHFYPNLSTKKTLLGLFYGLRGRDSSELAPRPQHCFGPPDGVHLRERTPLYRVFSSTSLHKRKAPLLGLLYGGEEGIARGLPLVLNIVSDRLTASTCVNEPPCIGCSHPLLSTKEKPLC